MKYSMFVPATLAALPCWGAQTLLTERTLSIEAAQEAARVALEQCRKDGHRVTVTVDPYDAIAEADSDDNVALMDVDVEALLVDAGVAVAGEG